MAPQTVPLRYFPTHSVGRMHTMSSLSPSASPITAGQRRLVMSRAPPHSVVTIRVRPSVVIRELDRIEHRPRSTYSYSATEDFLSSDCSKTWEDESRKIRAQTNSILQRINNSVPRSSSVVSSTTLARYNDPIIYPSKYSMDNYISRLLTPVSRVARNIESMSWYAEPAKRFIGRGHLACLRYSGNKGYSNRKALCQDLSVKDDVNLLSYYAKNRQAAAGLAIESVTAAPELK